jgi:hypothetical protein
MSLMLAQSQAGNLYWEAMTSLTYVTYTGFYRTHYNNLLHALDGAMPALRPLASREFEVVCHPLLK